MIKLNKNMNLDERNRAINFALFFGFKSESAVFPIASFDEGVEIPGSLEEFSLRFVSDIDKSIPEEYTSALDSAVAIQDFDWRGQRGLENIFGDGLLLGDENLDLLPDSIKAKIVLPDDASDEMVIAACNFAFRLGMETTAYETNIVADSNYKGVGIYFEDGAESSLRLLEDDKGIVFSGCGSDLVDLSTYVCEKFPLLLDGKSWVEGMQIMTRSFGMENLDGQKASLETATRVGLTNIVALLEKEDENLEQLRKEYPEVEIKSYKDEKLIYQDEYDIEWEVDTLRAILTEKVYPVIHTGDSVEVYGALSEEEDVRSFVKGEIEVALDKLGAHLKSCQLLCGYKQGISWIQEVVLPELVGQSLDKVCINFKSFLPEGVTSWGDESGVVPTYANAGNDDPDAWYDLPIRFLQELYPVEDILVHSLGLNREDVVFELADDAQKDTYTFTAYAKEEVVYSGNYDVKVSERPYMDECVSKGKVHPSTGYIKVVVNGEVILDKRIASDVEKIWDIYQSNVLPKCKEFIEEKAKGEVSLEQQPFFAKLELDITASEPDYKLSSREDLISTLDGLHEDMYFFAADYIRQYGVDNGIPALDAPGLVLPVIRKGEGKPKFVVSLYDRLATEPIITHDGELFRTVDTTPDRSKNLYVEEITYNKGKVNVAVRADITCATFIQSYAKLLGEDRLEVCALFDGIGAIELRHKDQIYVCPVSDKKRVLKDLSITDIDLCESKLIGYDEHIEIIEQLKRVPGLDVYKTARSYMGRDLYAIEILPELEGYVSRTKRLSRYPSLFINARHHANEVSGTNGAYLLLKELLSNDKYKQLGSKLNLVIVPLENVDGTAIHYELQKENPNWKLHVARFNAIGKEFYHEHFKYDTIHTEAHGLTNIWRKFLPDVMVDNHGVPSHEWEQQFSGYTAPAYKGFWLPRSLLYGYFWTVNGEAFKSNYAVNKAMEDIIAETMRKVPEVDVLNKEWMGQFHKFANGWMPKLFPAEYYKDMINYWIPFDFDVNHRYPSIKFPWITTVAYTSEVADETAQGSYLNLCGRAHLEHDLATIDMLLGAEVVSRNELSFELTGVKVDETRIRPIIVNK